MTSENAPSKGGTLSREAGLSPSGSLQVFLGVLIIVLGLAFYAQSFGGFVINASGQLGLMTVLTSLQALAFGSLAGLTFRRTKVMIGVGIVFAAAGITMLISPFGIIAAVVLAFVIVAFPNFINGTVMIISMVGMAKKLAGPLPAELVAVAPIMKRMPIIGMVAGVASIIFGVNILAGGLFSSIFGVVGWLILFPLILIIMGLLLLYMTYLSEKLLQMGASMGG